MYCTRLFVPLHVPTTGQKIINLKSLIMTYYQTTGACWLQREGTFCVKCSRELTECLTISQKGGALL